MSCEKRGHIRLRSLTAPPQVEQRRFSATRIDINVSSTNTTGFFFLWFLAVPTNERFRSKVDRSVPLAILRVRRRNRSCEGVNIFGEGTNAYSWRRVPWEITARKRPVVSATNIVLIGLFIFIGNLRFKLLKHNCLHLLFTSEREKRIRNDNYKYTIGHRAAPVRDYTYLSIRFYIA